MEHKQYVGTGLAFFGIANLLIGVFFPIIFFIPFFAFIIFGWVTDRAFYGPLDWLCLVIIDRFALSIFYIFSLLLFWSGISILRMKLYSRKLAIAAVSVTGSSFIALFFTDIIRSIAYSQVKVDFHSIWFLGLLLYLIFTILQLIYLNDPVIKGQFSDEEVRLPIKKIVLIVFILFIFPIFVYSLLYLLTINK